MLTVCKDKCNTDVRIKGVPSVINLTKQDIQNYLKRINKTKVCWIWIGRRNKTSGLFGVKGHTFSAVKIGYWLKTGIFEQNVKINKLCSTNFCVTPEHYDYNLPTVEERFWAKVDKSPGLGPKGDCWEWTAALSNRKKEYGAFGVKGKNVLAHIFSWVFHNGKIPNKLWVLHTCDNKKCVNPKHLWLGTVKDNTLDAKNKGKLLYGERHHHSKLTNEAVREIRKLHGKVRNLVLATKYNISERTVTDVAKRKCWKHIE